MTGQNAKIRSNHTLKLPYTAYRGALIGGHYRLQQLRLHTEFLDIFSVVCLCGHIFEAQAFSLSCPANHGNLLKSRRRRMKRIYRSDNFIDAFDRSGCRFLVSKVERSEKEWSDICQQVMRDCDDFALERPARPLGLGGARCAVGDRQAGYNSDDFHAPYKNEPLIYQASIKESSSYAAAVMKGLDQGT